jgi:hypothetical protein
MWIPPQVNAGQANAATGDQGYQDCLASAAAVGQALSISPDEVLLESTGVIGRRIKMDVRALLSLGVLLSDGAGRVATRGWLHVGAPWGTAELGSMCFGGWVVGWVQQMEFPMHVAC